ncbi:MAG TPA: porin [Nitrospiria bacterium]
MATNRIRLIGSIIIGFLLFGGNLGHAQETAMTAHGLLYGSPESFAEFHGFVTLTYYDFEEDGTRDGDSTFDQHYFYFNAIAKIRQNVTVFGEVEYEHGGEEFFLDRAFIEWSLRGEQLNLQLGKFYSPFGLELREYQYPVRKMTSRPLMMRNLLFNEWGETGLNLYGRLGSPAVSVDYAVAVVNGPNGDDTEDPANGIPEILEVGMGDNPNVGGTGDARQNRDNNNGRTVVGRLSANISGGAAVGVSYGEGRYSDTGSPDRGFTLTGVHANYRMKGLDVRGEWVSRKADVPATLVGAPGFPDDEMVSSSYYVQASYKFRIGKEGLEYIEPVVRYDALEPDKDVDDDERTRTTIGINYAPYPQFKFMAEWQMNEEKSNPDLNDDGVMISATVDF